VPDGDEARAEVVGRHAQFVLAGLHIHHTGEDENPLPLLLERARCWRSCPAYPSAHARGRRPEVPALHLPGPLRL